MLIMFGNRTRKFVEGAGKFVCPQCRTKNAYELICTQTWFTLFLVPALPMDRKSEPYVECSGCKRIYYQEVLKDNNEPHLTKDPERLNIKSFLTAAKKSDGAKPKKHAPDRKPARVERACPLCFTRIRLPSGQSGKVVCPKCRVWFDAST